MPTVVTISRQLGAGGAMLGRQLAESLHMAYLDREILRAAADKAGLTEDALGKWEERCSRFWDRLVESLGAGPAEGMFTVLPAGPTVRDRQLFTLEAEVIQELATDREAVVIGRGGFWILRQHPEVIRVYLHAPVEARIPLVRDTYKLATDAAAREMIVRVDNERNRYIHEMTGENAFDAQQYDLTANTAMISVETLARWVTELVKQKRAALGKGI